MSGLGNSLKKPDWDTKTLPVFEKNFYKEHPDIAAMSWEEVDGFRKEHEMNVTGKNVPKPVRNFDEASFPCKSLSGWI
jgi:ATP-dependent RNA helicase DDX5/DBP2